MVIIKNSLSHDQKAKQKLTARYAVPGSTVGCSVYEAAVVVILATWWPIGVRHGWVKSGVRSSQALENGIIWAGAILMSTA